MKTKSSTLLTIALLLLTSTSSVHAQSETTSQNIASNIASNDSLLDRMPWDERTKLTLDSFAVEIDKQCYYTSICVWDLTADSLLWSLNSNKMMRPASTMKVLTSVSALDKLSAQYEIRTQAFYTGSITADSVLNGDIYVVGDFDPMLCYNDIKELAQSIRNSGIRSISGTVYGDASMTSSDLYGYGWCWDDVPCKSMPYLSPLMAERGMECPNFNKYSTDPLFHPTADFAKALSLELASANITPADTTLNRIPSAIKEYASDGTLLFTKTRTVQQILQRLLKNSDNLHAEALFFHLAKQQSTKRCTYKDAMPLIESVIMKAGASPSNVKIADGSGVSLYNYVTADVEVALLRYAYHNPKIYEHFYNSLPIAGVDGTLEKRMKNGNAHQNVHAKTGTVEGVTALAGYVKASNEHELAFSIISNGVPTSSIGRQLEDRICQALAK